uniref:Dicer-like 3 n=1 Tax=Pinus canariensis TaxID=49510 RepID=A0A0C4VYR3_9CONI|nr:Dicer-like 3 [Pinus canariensis]
MMGTEEEEEQERQLVEDPVVIKKRKRESSTETEEAAAEEVIPEDSNEVDLQEEPPVEDPLMIKKKKRELSTEAESAAAAAAEEVVPEACNGEELQEEENQLLPTNPYAIARRYQLEVLRLATENNTIAYLETGCGKTLIAVLLIKEIGCELIERKEKGIIIFLAPTVSLVEQQFEVIKLNSHFKVAEYFGAKGVDNWTIDKWTVEINSHEVLVMTPQILLDALRHGFLKLEMVKLMIFDECHHAQGHHPYAKIMNEHYHTSEVKPKIFGMTASPVIRKGISSSHDCEDQIARLEDILDSKVYALEDRSELELFVPTPNQKILYYSRSAFNQEALKLQLVSLKEKYETPRDCESNKLQSHFKDDEDFIKNLRKQIRSIHGNILYCLEKLGSFCAYKAVQIYMERHKIDSSLEIDIEALDGIQRTKNGFLEEALEVLKDAMPSGMERFLGMQEDNLVGVKEGLLTPKIHVLLRCLLSYRQVKEIRCIIFVDRVIAATVISRLIKELDCLSYISSDYLAGETGLLDIIGPKPKQNTLDLFRTGKVNVLVTTNVTEEGIDVQDCRSIIRFDLPSSVRSYIQSRGRARRPESDYIVLLERSNEKQLNLFYNVIRSENSMRNLSLNRSHIPLTPKASVAKEPTLYSVSRTGASVNCDSSVSFIYKYCSKLPGDKYYLPRPEFVFRSVEGEENLHVCTLRLPPNAPFQEVLGPPSNRQIHAKQLACLEACKRLHEVGAVDDYLIPITEAVPEEEETVNSKGKNTTGAGTTKRKELHAKAKAKALCGSWGKELNGVVLQIYKLVFMAQDNDEKAYADFALFIEGTLDDDVANAEIDLHLTAGRVVKARFAPSGKMYLNSIQITDAKVFQEILYNGIFDKLIKRTKSSNGVDVVMKNILGTKKIKRAWASSNIYFLLPLESNKGSFHDTKVNIDWKCISKCADVARAFEYYRTKLQVGEDDSSGIYLASGPILTADLIDKAIVTIHTGKIYCVTDVLHDKTAESPFPELQDSEMPSYFSYSDYFQKKYGRNLNYLKQPLLQLKQSHRPHNLLTRHVEKSQGKACDVRPNCIEMPPELCLNLGVPNSVIRSLYLVPSVMHRMASLMLATQLRQEIQECSNCPFIPATLIMQAVTTMRCLESFSLERLELLGDSVLKYAVSSHLFLKYNEKHEGQLTARRSWAICNASLHRVAILRNLPGYIRDEPFDPRRWFAPGTLSPKSVPCCCDSNFLKESVNGMSEMEGKTVKIGKTCDKGHRWMCSKTIADSVEALIGAYLVGKDLDAALKFMSWMNIEVASEPELVTSAFERASVHPSVLRSVNIHGLESQLGYVFHNKGLLVEAITHASQQDFEGGCCYQRLEFLGDSVLDLLITQHLFSEHPDLPPGVLTDLRSAAVNNKKFAHVAVQHNLHQYLRHGSGILLGQITRFVKAVQEQESKNQSTSLGPGVQAPKVLGDLVESIAGAILIDSKFDIKQVWEIMRPLLSPIVTPETLDLHPLREVSELCHLKGYPIVWKKSIQEGKLVIATMEVAVEDNTLIGKGCKTSKKSAKEKAAREILKQMEERGICHPRHQRLTGREALDTEARGTIKRSLEESVGPEGISRKKTRLLNTSEECILDCPWKNLNSRRSLHTGEGTIRQQNPDKGIAPLIIAERCKNKLEANQTREFLPRKKARGIMTLGNSGTSQDTGNPSVAYNQRCSPSDEGGNNFGASYNNINRHETNFGESNSNNNGREAVSSLLTALENKRLASNNSNGSEDMLGASYNNNNGSESVSTPAIPVANKLPLNSGSEAVDFGKRISHLSGPCDSTILYPT